MGYIINLFGTGIRYWNCDIKNEQFEEMFKIKQQHKVEWERLLFDFDFLKRFGYNHWSELSKYSEQTGIIIDYQNRIEIKHGAKFITRCSASDLTNCETLFPIYNTFNFQNDFPRQNDCQRMILVQVEIGLCAKYSFECEEFNIDHLRFGLTQIAQYPILQQWVYQDETLSIVKDETMVIGTKVLY